jgi:hypothetical protein
MFERDKLMKQMHKAILKHSEHLTKEDFIQIADHGADAGWDGFCYYHETTLFYNDNETMIWDYIEMEAEEFGCKSVLTFLEVYCATKSVANLTQLKNWASWYILESVAYWIRDQEANK